MKISMQQFFTITITVTSILFFIVYVYTENPSHKTHLLSLPTKDYEGDINSTNLNFIALEIRKNREALESIRNEYAKNIAEINNRLDTLSANTTNNTAEIIEENEDQDLQAIHDFENAIAQEQEQFEEELVDFTWAPKAEVNLEVGLDELQQELSFELVDSQCRTTRCNATVVFENYALAEQYGNQLAEVSIPGLNCAQSISLPQPGDTSAGYQANLLLDCSQQVLGNVQPTY